MPKIDLISIDTGENCGIALWNDKICLETFTIEFRKDRYVWQNLQKVVETLVKYIPENYPTIAIEQPARSLATQWSLFKDIRMLADSMRCSFRSYMPTAIKKAATGSGRADKDAIKEAISNSGQLDSGVIPSDEHQFDAIAVGMCYMING